MNIIQAVILGLIQGLTEFLPISSSAHLIIFPRIFNWPEHTLTFDLVLHLGTLLAVIIYFYKKIYELLRPIFKRDVASRERSVRVVFNIFLSTLAVIPMYLIIKLTGVDFHEFSIVTVLMLILLGIPMITLSSIKGRGLSYFDLNNSGALKLGLAQSLALISGLSRSGITILTGLLLGLKKSEASEYSFLISIPVILGAFVLDLVTLRSTSQIEPIATIIIGGICSFIGGFIAISFLMRYLNTHSLAVFGYYRIILAIILIFLFFI